MDEMDDMFGEVTQPEREQEHAETSRRKPLTADDVRGQMLDIIATLQGADEQPYDAIEWRKHAAMFPIMAQWLDPAEGEQLVFKFAAEIKRLKLAA